MGLSAFLAGAVIFAAIVVPRAGLADGHIECSPTEQQREVLQGQVRRALVIGNASYTQTAGPGRRPFERLNSPLLDAERMASALCSLGFTVRSVRDADAGMQHAAVAAFARDNVADSTPDQVRVVYFSGHGVQEPDGANILLPVDSHAETASALGVGLPQLNDAARAGSRGREAVKLFFFDACRSLVPARRGLADPGEQPSDSIIAFATEPGGLTRDGQVGEMSPWTTALMARIRQPGLEIQELLAATRGDLASRSIQSPQTYAALSRAFHLNPAPTITWRASRVDDSLRVVIKATTVFQSEVRAASQATMSFSLLQVGENPFVVHLHNQRTRRGGNSWGSREGWNYTLRLSIGPGFLHPAQNYVMMSDGENQASEERWGREFPVFAGSLFVDAEAGTVTGSSFASTPNTRGTCTKEPSGGSC